MDESPGTGAERGAAGPLSRPGTARAGVPRWVKVLLGVGVAILAMVFLAVMFGVGGDHGPGHHLGLHGGAESVGSTSATIDEPEA